MFFKRLSRSRTNSDSYVDENWNHSPRAGKDIDTAGPPSSYKTSGNPENIRSISADNAKNMYARPQDPQSFPNSPTAIQSRPLSNGMNPRTRDSGFVDSTPLSTGKPHEPAPDLLTRAFNEAVRPYQDKIDTLEQQLSDLKLWVDGLEQQRIDLYAWIDKRGLRPDVPPNVAKHMDSHPDAAPSLNAQLDRKITIVNFDLHRLQDDLNDNISSSHFAAAMLKFLPEIQRLSMLPSGSRYAFELIIKLAGNLNSHGGVEANGSNNEEVEEDKNARTVFYERLDVEMEGVCRKRVLENEDWVIARDVKRLEKNGAYLKNYGVDTYFPRSLELMRHEAEFKTQGQGNQMQVSQVQSSQPAAPPRY